MSGLTVLLMAVFAFVGSASAAEVGENKAKSITPYSVSPIKIQSGNLGIIKVAPSGSFTGTRGSDCFVDWNGDSAVDTRDIIAFLGDWTAREIRADINGDGVIDRSDFRAFMSAWRQGCQPNPGSITKCVVADFNKDATIDTRDLTAYLNVWSQKDVAADINSDGVVGQDDFNAFLNLWKSCTAR